MIYNCKGDKICVQFHDFLFDKNVELINNWQKNILGGNFLETLLSIY